ncbi:hypothetical protein FACS1894109_10890 [Spirochaetia bacterium]|nr:hypothetical protein FACS1894109_10890 [Spirochaetia bacterium]
MIIQIERNAKGYHVYRDGMNGCFNINTFEEALIELVDMFKRGRFNEEVDKYRWPRPKAWDMAQ